VNTPPDWIVNRADPVLGIGKRVLAVEGVRDVQIYSGWLQKLAPDGIIADSKVVVVETGGKGPLIDGLKWYRDYGGNPAEVFGLRDRDEWDAAKIASESLRLPQLRVNANRHCLESYFCDPDEIQAAFLAHDGAKFSPHLVKLQADIRAPLLDWVDHWSLWTTTNRINAEMRGAKFPNLFHHQYKLPPDAEIQQRLTDWSAIVEPIGVFGQFNTLRTATRLRPPNEQFHSCVHAKKFFPVVVYEKALRPLDAQDWNEWMQVLATWMPTVPLDIGAILHPLLA
jgi:hypothetical protein